MNAATATLTDAAAPAARGGVRGAEQGRIQWVGFKWLMCREGEHIDVARAVVDPGYARFCLERGLRAPDADLREISRRMLERLGLA